MHLSLSIAQLYHNNVWVQVSEYMDNDVRNWVDTSPGEITFATVRKLAHDTLLGLQCLHTQGFVHDDVTS